MLCLSQYGRLLGGSGGLSSICHSAGPPRTHYLLTLIYDVSGVGCDMVSWLQAIDEGSHLLT